jgi:hypothetical protein
MDEQRDSSLGLIIAIIAGGLVLAVVVLVLLGFGLFRLLPAPMPPAAVGPAPMPVAVEGPVVAEAGPPVFVEGPQPAGGPPPMPPIANDVSPQAKRFLGEWETTQPDGTKATMFFGVDGRLRLLKQPPAADAPDSMMLRWEILDGKGDRFRVRYISENKVYDVQQEFEFQDNDRLVIHGPFRENDRWVVRGADGTATYHRKK